MAIIQQLWDNAWDWLMRQNVEKIGGQGLASPSHTAGFMVALLHQLLPLAKALYPLFSPGAGL